MLKIVQAIETVDIFMQEYPQWNIHAFSFQSTDRRGETHTHEFALKSSLVKTMIRKHGTNFNWVREFQNSVDKMQKSAYYPVSKEMYDTLTKHGHVVFEDSNPAALFWESCSWKGGNDTYEITPWYRYGKNPEKNSETIFEILDAGDIHRLWNSAYGSDHGKSDIFGKLINIPIHVTQVWESLYGPAEDVVKFLRKNPLVVHSKYRENDCYQNWSISGRHEIDVVVKLSDEQYAEFVERNKKSFAGKEWIKSDLLNLKENPLEYNEDDYENK